MSSFATTDITISKKDLEKSRLPVVGSRTIKFYHKASLGDTTISLNSLSMPPEMSGMAQATPEEISGARLWFNKKNVSLNSSVNNDLMQGLHYDIIDSYTIVLKGVYLVGADANEIFEGTVYCSPVSDLTVISGKPIMKSYTLAPSQTTLNLGLEYAVDANPNEAVGSIRVYADGKLTRRGIEYNEVDSGNKYGITIEFITPSLLAKEIDVDFGYLAITDNNALGTMESMLQGMRVMAQDLASLALEPISKYMDTNPSEVERRVFGDLVYSNQGTIAALQQTVDDLQDDFDAITFITQTKWQRKTLSVNVSTNIAIPDLSFNNLTIGNTYKITANCSWGLPPSGFTDASVTLTHNAASLLFLRASATHPSNSHAFAFGNQTTFVATATTITASFSGNLGGNLNSGSHVTLEELPNHVVTTDWT